MVSLLLFLLRPAVYCIQQLQAYAPANTDNNFYCCTRIPNPIIARIREA